MIIEIGWFIGGILLYVIWARYMLVTTLSFMTYHMALGKYGYVVTHNDIGHEHRIYTSIVIIVHASFAIISFAYLFENGNWLSLLLTACLAMIAIIGMTRLSEYEWQYDRSNGHWTNKHVL